MKTKAPKITTKTARLRGIAAEIARQLAALEAEIDRLEGGAAQKRVTAKVTKKKTAKKTAKRPAPAKKGKRKSKAKAR